MIFLFSTLMQILEKIRITFFPVTHSVQDLVEPQPPAFTCRGVLGICPTQFFYILPICFTNLLLRFFTTATSTSNDLK